MIRKRKRKGDIELETLAWWIIALIVLVIVVFGLFILKGKGIGAIEFIKNLFTFKK